MLYACFEGDQQQDMAFRISLATETAPPIAPLVVHTVTHRRFVDSSNLLNLGQIVLQNSSNCIKQSSF